MEAPIKVLAIVPAPRDAAWAAAATAAWRSLETSLRPATDSGRIHLVRLQPATAAALDDALQREPFGVIHVITRGTSRPVARYGTLTLEAGDGRARMVNAQNFARACAQAHGLEVVILQNAGGAPGDLDVLRDALVEQAASVICAPEPSSGEHGSAPFVRLFYEAFATGRSLEGAFLHATGNPAGLPVAAGGAGGTGEPCLKQRNQVAAVAAAARPAPHVNPHRAGSPVVSVALDGPMPAGEGASTVAVEIQRKRDTGAFDVFLCHNVGDKPAVMTVGRQLLSAGILPWLDLWELRPGTPWQRILEEQIANIHAAAVFVGRDGIGPWQRQELDGFLREFNKRGCPVIPVMLPGAAGEPQLPLFLRGMTWVDFRIDDPDPLAQLIWGITGKRPDHR